MILMGDWLMAVGSILLNSNHSGVYVVREKKRGCEGGGVRVQVRRMVDGRSEGWGILKKDKSK